MKAYEPIRKDRLMKQGRLLSTILLFLLSLSLGILCGCSSDSDSSGGEDGGTVVALSALEVTATPETINPNGTSTIEATAYDAIGKTIANVPIVFSIDDATMASITTGSVTTNESGVAQVILTARNKSGEVDVTAKSGSISSTPTTVTIGSTSVEVTIAALEVVATPDSINPNETTTIQATAFDASGNTIAGVDVVFTLDDPTLAFIASTATTNNNGVAEVFLTARNKAGAVNVTATAGEVDSEVPETVTILGGSVPETINLTVTPASISVLGTATVRAEVLDIFGDPVTDGTSVSFVSNNTLYGDFSSPTSTTTNGFATATFETTNTNGTTSVTVQSGSVSTQTNIVVYPAPAFSVEFVSATPQRIAIQGSGGTETSIIQFIVKDTNGNPREGEMVSFTMRGPRGGEKIDPSGDTTPHQIDVSSRADGIAQVILNSGSVAGPVTIQATITVIAEGNEIDISSQSSVISIGGGIASAKRFSIAFEKLNLPGLEYNNRTTDISAYLADRFGNYNILDGTSVSFITESGLTIQSSNVTADEMGVATSKARTQGPILSTFEGPEDVIPLSWEVTLIDYIDSTYDFYAGGLPYGHPRDGLCSVLVVVRGEEYFEDDNGNGVYDPGELFVDSFDDPFVDSNDNGNHESSPSPTSDADPFEEYIDSGQDGDFDGYNNAWDSDKNIFASAKVLITGSPIILSDTGDGFTIANGRSREFNVIVCDRNLNVLSPGTKVSITADNGKLIGRTTETIGDTNNVGPNMASQLNAINYNFDLMDSDPDDEEEEPEAATVTIKITWEGKEFNHTLTGTID